VTALKLNVMLGAAVATVGFWMVWSDLPEPAYLLIAGAAAGLLQWQGRSIPAVWGWATALLGLESLAWPIRTMLQIGQATPEGAQPTDQQMGAILTSMLFGLFSSIFWLTFSYWIFKRMVWKEPEQSKSQP
jgi:hypothetical protein